MLSGLGDRYLPGVDYHGAGPTWLAISDMLPKRASGPLQERLYELPTLRAAHGLNVDLAALRAGLSGKRWHSYVVPGSDSRLASARREAAA